MSLANMREHGVKSVGATCEDSKTLGRQGAGIRDNKIQDALIRREAQPAKAIEARSRSL